MFNLISILPLAFERKTVSSNYLEEIPTKVYRYATKKIIKKKTKQVNMMEKIMDKEIVTSLEDRERNNKRKRG